MLQLLRAQNFKMESFAIKARTSERAFNIAKVYYGGMAVKRISTFAFREVFKEVVVGKSR